MAIELLNASIADLADFSQKSFWIAFACITFNPCWWNVVARQEYKKRYITKLFRGNPYHGCYALAVAIFSLGIFRDFLYKTAVEHQPKVHELDSSYVKMAATVLFIMGNTFVLSSMYALGITGTYLGDYFGILMEERVTCFPFNVLENPMYYGSTMVFLASALWYASPAGLLLTAWVFICYLVALQFEGPFTAMIYANKENAEKAKKAH